MRKIILYIVIGLIAACIDFGVFYVLRRTLGVDLLLANSSGVCSGIAFSFYANRRFNFQAFDRAANRFFRFATVAFVGLAVSNGLIYFLMAFFSSDAVAKAVTIAIVGGCQFIINNSWTFSAESKPKSSETALE